MVSKKGGRCCSSGYYEETPFSLFPLPPASADDKWKRCCPVAPALPLSLSLSLAFGFMRAAAAPTTTTVAVLVIECPFRFWHSLSAQLLSIRISRLLALQQLWRAPALLSPNYLFVSCICKYFGVFFSSNTTHEDVALPRPTWPGISSNAWMTYSSSSCCALHAFLVAAVVADYQLFLLFFVSLYLWVCSVFMSLVSSYCFCLVVSHVQR
jgi:hypothetical protein